jgi:hypothetical protein
MLHELECAVFCLYGNLVYLYVSRCISSFAQLSSQIIAFSHEIGSNTTVIYITQIHKTLSTVSGFQSGYNPLSNGSSSPRPVDHSRIRVTQIALGSASS